MLAFKRISRALLSLMCAFTVLVLSGCSGIDITSNEFISPPKVGGEMQSIETALKDSITTEKYTLKYPTDGDYRSAYICCDLTGKGIDNFAMAFYSSTTEDNVVTMHLNLMKKTDGKWNSISDSSIAGVGVEKVELFDLNGDGIKEIIVGYVIYAGLDKRVMVYSLKGLKLIPIMQEQYTSFLCCDITNDQKKELFLLNHNTSAEKASLAKYFAFENDTVREAGSCLIDSSVTSYNSPTVNNLPNGQPAIFVDGVKGVGMQTEIIFYKDGQLIAPMYNSENPEFRSPTYRNGMVASKDINGDGYVDIPYIESINVFSGDIDETTLLPITTWKTYNGNNFSVSLMTVINYTDGYYFEFPNKWQNKTTVGMAVDTRLCTVSLWDTETRTVISELLKIRTISEAEWDIKDNGFNGYKEIVRSNGVVYAVSASNYQGTETISEDEFKTMFHLIG